MIVLLLACAKEEPAAVDPGDSADTAVVAAASPALVFAGDHPQNLLVLSLDTTRRDRIGLYSGRDTTPNLDAVFGRGVVLDDHRSCANWTAPSMLCAMTGRSPLDDDFWPSAIYDELADLRIPVTPSKLPTLATLLAQRGYAAGLVTANTVFSPLNSEAMVEGYYEINVEAWGGAAGVVADGLPMLARLAGSGPWFGHLHFIDPHTPYTAPREYNTGLADLDPDGEFPWDVTDNAQASALIAAWPSLTPEMQELARQLLLAVYDGELRYWDAQFGALWQELDAGGYLDDTLVVVFADHGEQLGEHQDFHHGQSLHPEETRVPAAFWARNLVSGRWAGPTMHQDLAPTILAALASEPNDEHLGAVVGLGADTRNRFAFCYLPGYCETGMSLVLGPYQLTYEWSGKRSFYDLAADPEAHEDRWDASDPIASALWMELQPEVVAVEARWPFLAAEL